LSRGSRSRIRALLAAHADVFSVVARHCYIKPSKELLLNE